MNPNSLIDVPQCSSQPHQSDYENNMNQQQLINPQPFDDQFDLKNQENMKDCDQNLDFPSDSTNQIPNQSRTSREPNKTANDPHGQNRQVVDDQHNTAYPKKKNGKTLTPQIKKPLSDQSGDSNQQKKNRRRKMRVAKKKESVSTKSLPNKLIRYFMCDGLDNSQIQLEVPYFIKQRMVRCAECYRSQKLSMQHKTYPSATKLIAILEGVKGIQDITFNLYRKYCLSSTFKSSIVNIFISFFQCGSACKQIMKKIFNWNTICNTLDKKDPIFRFEPEIRMMIYQYKLTGIAPLGITVLQVQNSIKFIKNQTLSVIFVFLNKNKAAKKEIGNKGFQQQIRKQFNYINEKETSYLLEPMIDQLLDNMKQFQKQTDLNQVRKSFETYLDELFEKIQKFQPQFSKQNEGTTSNSEASTVQDPLRQEQAMNGISVKQQQKIYLKFFKSLLTLCGFIRTLSFKGKPGPLIAALFNLPIREKKKRNTSKQPSIKKSSTDTRSLTKKQMKTMKKLQKNSTSNNTPVSPHAQSSNLQTQVEENPIEGLKPLKKVKLSNSQEKETALPQSSRDKTLNQQLSPEAVSPLNIKGQRNTPQEKIQQQQCECQESQSQSQMAEIESESDNWNLQQVNKDAPQKDLDLMAIQDLVVRNLRQEHQNILFSQLGNSNYQAIKTKQIGAQYHQANELQQITNSLFDYQQFN